MDGTAPGPAGASRRTSSGRTARRIRPTCDAEYALAVEGRRRSRRPVVTTVGGAVALPARRQARAADADDDGRLVGRLDGPGGDVHALRRGARPARLRQGAGSRGRRACSDKDIPGDGDSDRRAGRRERVTTSRASSASPTAGRRAITACSAPVVLLPVPRRAVARRGDGRPDLRPARARLERRRQPPARARGPTFEFVPSEVAASAGRAGARGACGRSGAIPRRCQSVWRVRKRLSITAA